MAVELERGAIIRSDGEVVEMRFTPATHDTIRVTDVWGGHPAYVWLDQENTRWARGEWDSPAVVALRSLAALAVSW